MEFFFKEKSDLKNVMMVLVKNLKLSIICKYNTHAVTMQVRMLPLKKPSNGKDGDGIQVHDPRALQQNGQVKHKFTTLFSRVSAMLKGRKFTTFLKMAYELKPPILPFFSRTILLLPIET